MKNACIFLFYFVDQKCQQAKHVAWVYILDERDGQRDLKRVCGGA
jgi:hypothetical protein